MISNYSRQKKGFTLIELLVVIALIALLANISYAAINNARRKSRDAKRVADVKSIQSGLELYYNDRRAYPSGNNLQLGSANYTVLCNTAAGFVANSGACGAGTIYIGKISAPPATPVGDAYLYTSSSGSSYSIIFALEGATGSLTSGTKTATPQGISN